MASTRTHLTIALCIVTLVIITFLAKVSFNYHLSKKKIEFNDATASLPVCNNPNLVNSMKVKGPCDDMKILLEQDIYEMAITDMICGTIPPICYLMGVQKSSLTQVVSTLISDKIMAITVTCLVIYVAMVSLGLIGRPTNQPIMLPVFTQAQYPLEAYASKKIVEEEQPNAYKYKSA